VTVPVVIGLEIIHVEHHASQGKIVVPGKLDPPRRRSTEKGSVVRFARSSMLANRLREETSSRSTPYSKYTPTPM
jgi:hypothetical protein